MDKDNNLNYDLTFKALQFTEELNELLNKYKVEMTGSSFEDGTIDIAITENGQSEYFYLQDVNNNLQLNLEYEDYLFKGDKTKRTLSKNVLEYMILNALPESITSVSDNINIPIKLESNRVHVLTNNRVKYDNFKNTMCDRFEVIEIQDNLNEPNFTIIENDIRVNYYKFRTSDNIRGYRFKKLIIDKDIILTKEEFENLMCSCIYLTKDDVQFI